MSDYSGKSKLPPAPYPYSGTRWQKLIEGSKTIEELTDHLRVIFVKKYAKKPTYEHFKRLFQGGPYTMVWFGGGERGRPETIESNDDLLGYMDKDTLEEYCHRGVDDGWLLRDWDTFITPGHQEASEREEEERDRQWGWTVELSARWMGARQQAADIARGLGNKRGADDLIRDMELDLKKYLQAHEAEHDVGGIMAIWQKLKADQKAPLEEFAGQDWADKAIAAKKSMDAPPPIKTIAKAFKDIKRTQRVQFRDKVVSGPEDLAVLAQTVRDPQYETFRRIYVDDDGRILAHEAVSSRMPQVTAMGIEGGFNKEVAAMQEHASRIGAKGVYLVHNHPGGDPKPSPADIELTKQMGRAMPDLFKGHVVINSGKYVVIDKYGLTSTELLPEYKKNIKWKDPILNRGRRNERGKLAYLDEELQSPGDIAAWAKQLVSDPGSLPVVVYLGAGLKVRGVQEISIEALMNYQLIWDNLPQLLLEFGSTNAAVVIPQEASTKEVTAMLDKYIKKHIFMEGISYDEAGQFQSAMIRTGTNFSYDSFAGRKIADFKKDRTVMQTENEQGILESTIWEDQELAIMGASTLAELVAILRRLFPHTKEEMTAIMDAYHNILRKTSNPYSVSIAGLQRETGPPMDDIRAFVRKKVRQGLAVLTPGDWELSTEQHKAGAIEVDGTKHLFVEFKSGAFEPDEEAEPVDLPQEERWDKARESFIGGSNEVWNYTGTEVIAKGLGSGLILPGEEIVFARWLNEQGGPFTLLDYAESRYGPKPIADMTDEEFIDFKRRKIREHGNVHKWYNSDEFWELSNEISARNKALKKTNEGSEPDGGRGIGEESGGDRGIPEREGTGHGAGQPFDRDSAAERSFTRWKNDVIGRGDTPFNRQLIDDVSRILASEDFPESARQYLVKRLDAGKAFIIPVESINNLPPAFRATFEAAGAVTVNHARINVVAELEQYIDDEVLRHEMVHLAWYDITGKTNRRGEIIKASKGDGIIEQAFSDAVKDAETIIKWAFKRDGKEQLDWSTKEAAKSIKRDVLRTKKRADKERYGSIDVTDMLELSLALSGDPSVYRAACYLGMDYSRIDITIAYYNALARRYENVTLRGTYGKEEVTAYKAGIDPAFFKELFDSIETDGLFESIEALFEDAGPARWYEDVIQKTDNFDDMARFLAWLFRAPLPPMSKMLIDEDGKEQTVHAPRGLDFSVKYELREAADLITSHDTDFNKDERFPHELGVQNKDRNRLAAREQVNAMVRDMVTAKPELLGESLKSNDGAPIVGTDNVVESGNGRTIAIKAAYESGRAGKYLEWLKANAAQFGLTVEKITQFSSPVLIRVRQTPVEDLGVTRGELAVAMNQESGLRLSPYEQAMDDAAKITDEMLAVFDPPESGDILGSTNRDFVHSFLQLLTTDERAEYLTKDGQPTAKLAQRIKNAIFARAYQDENILSMVTEEDSEVRSITNALMKASARFAEIRALDADLTNVNVTKTVVEACQYIIQAKRLAAADNVRGSLAEKVKQATRQQGLFNKLDETVEKLAIWISENHTRTNLLAAAFRLMADWTEKELRARKQMSIFPRKPLTVPEIVTHGIEGAGQILEAISVTDGWNWQQDIEHAQSLGDILAVLRKIFNPNWWADETEEEWRKTLDRVDRLTQLARAYKDSNCPLERYRLSGKFSAASRGAARYAQLSRQAIENLMDDETGRLVYGADGIWLHQIQPTNAEAAGHTNKKMLIDAGDRFLAESVDTIQQDLQQLATLRQRERELTEKHRAIKAHWSLLVYNEFSRLRQEHPECNRIRDKLDEIEEEIIRVLRTDGRDMTRRDELYARKAELIDQRTAIFKAEIEPHLEDIKAKASDAIIGPYVEMTNAEEEAREKAKAIGNKVRNALLERSPVTDQEAHTFLMQSTIPKAILKKQVDIKDAVKELYTLTGGVLNPLEIEAIRGRAHVKEGRRTIYASAKNFSSTTLYHECGHLIDVALPAGQREALQSWIMEKAEKKKDGRPVIASLRTLTKNKGYKSSERAVSDHFINHYVGKVYDEGPSPPASEVFSMGLEQFSSPQRIVNLMLADLDHFRLTIGVILQCQEESRKRKEQQL